MAEFDFRYSNRYAWNYGEARTLQAVSRIEEAFYLWTSSPAAHASAEDEGTGWGGSDMDMTSIQAAVGSLKAATDIGVALLKLKTGAEVQAKVVELNTVILAAQRNALAANAEQLTLLQRIGELEKEIAGVKKWEAEKDKYELKQIYSGYFAYEAKPITRGAEPAHYICAHCYQKDRKSILQQNGSVDLICPD